MEKIKNGITEMDGKQFMTDSRGGMIPVEMVNELDKLRDQTIRGIAARAIEMRDKLSVFKGKMRDDLLSYLALSSEQYGKKYGGRKGNVTLLSYDGSLKLVLAVNENIVFDERLQIAKSIIDECISRWSEGSRDEIRALINDAFYVDKAGNINTTRILGLRRLNIQDAEWKRAMDAITDSIQVSGSKEYLRVYTREKDGEYRQVPLDVASL
jgi:hypothetical protein